MSANSIRTSEMPSERQLRSAWAQSLKASSLASSSLKGFAVLPSAPLCQSVTAGAARSTAKPRSRMPSRTLSIASQRGCWTTKSTCSSSRSQCMGRPCRCSIHTGRQLSGSGTFSKVQARLRKKREALSSAATTSMSSWCPPLVASSSIFFRTKIFFETFPKTLARPRGPAGNLLTTRRTLSRQPARSSAICTKARLPVLGMPTFSWPPPSCESLWSSFCMKSTRVPASWRRPEMSGPLAPLMVIFLSSSPSSAPLQMLPRHSARTQLDFWGSAPVYSEILRLTLLPRPKDDRRRDRWSQPCSQAARSLGTRRVMTTMFSFAGGVTNGFPGPLFQASEHLFGPCQVWKPRVPASEAKKLKSLGLAARPKGGRAPRWP
mmetsp:Transcript_67674/g.218600  ORF Transcript_67674/g.218600 Transcript_67674/m.218600 type:complete len:377 (+) Transcript_67674:84-1214(+)